jgi:hypothetical protein
VGLGVRLLERSGSVDLESPVWMVLNPRLVSWKLVSADSASPRSASTTAPEKLYSAVGMAILKPVN